MPFLFLLTALADVPDFELRDLDRQKVSLSSFEGQYVLLNFWATWCTSCQMELDELQRLQEAYADDGLIILAISIDDARSSSKVKPSVKAQGWTFRVLLDTQTRVVGQLNPSKSLPWLALIDPTGDEVWTRTEFSHGDSCEIARRLEVAMGPLEPTAEGFCSSK